MGQAAEKARRLYDGGRGLGYKAIAKELGVSRDRARDWVRPDRRRTLHARRARLRRLRGETKHRTETATRAIVVLLWHDGATIKEIAARIGWTANSVGTAMNRWREEGLDLPYRYRGYPR